MSKRKWIKLPPPYRNVEVIPGRFQSFGEITVPATFRIKNITTGKVHEVERIVVDTCWTWKGPISYSLECDAEVHIKNFNLTTDPITCKYCLHGRKRR